MKLPPRLRPAQTPVSAAENGVQGLPFVRVATHEDVEGLAEEILDPRREQLVVGLTSREGEDEPSVDPFDVRALVGAGPQIYYLPTGALTVDLRARLPGRFTPFNGSLRVWFPGITPQSDPNEHINVFDASGVYGYRSLQFFAYKLHEALTARQIALEVDPVLVYRELASAKAREDTEEIRTELEEKLRRVGSDRERAERRAEQALARAELAERRLRIAERDHANTPARTNDPAGALHLLILDRWLETMTLEDRARHPLGKYVLAPEFVQAVEVLSYLVRDRIAFVCAMIAANRTANLTALAVTARQAHGSQNGDASQDGDGAQAVPADGSSAWQCTLTRADSDSPPAVLYLQWADGTIEFQALSSARATSLA
ncbi:MAG: hypothetical protein H0X28_13450 [Solirubrobacterales bacterium]|nr:hypothetical protein [Solirubrobacterales bacterium]